ncbi:hypothetical protein B5S28_g1406 [[Candida] boidinii]|nr:hypothetical protein B5S28_g1406 [[Candida] boidinii]OWB60564.1 hypothetical protein B5S29_g1440 [[Candida] boidinii]OWB76876.1 hypothetical protein B5S32_g1033 [[Candida] boidinii]
MSTESNLNLKTSNDAAVTAAYKLITDNIEKPDIDNREYKLIELPNKLQCLLISDPITDKSAAALDVNVGSFNDPNDIPGLAHFLEHLLFMGTEKFPSENEYSSYLSKNSGSSNAFTAAQHTNYYFEVANDAMEGALDRFSQFFISPLFDKNCKDREINAVDSENKKNLQSDLWRLYQLSKSLTNPIHPYCKFSTGNKITLGDDPIKKNVDVREVLMNFHKNYYSANIMKLVILSNKDLNTLTNWAIENFSNVKNKNVERPFYKESPFNTNNYSSKLIKAKPIMESRNLEISFPVPDSSPFWKSSPTKYLSHLLGHESEGSLLYNFKEKSWANGLSCGSMGISSGFSNFVMSIELTPLGLENYKSIITDVFKYIQMLKIEGPKEWVFTEIRDDSITSFKFKQKGSASSTVSRLAGTLHNLKYHNTSSDLPKESFTDIPEFETIPPEFLLSSSSIVREYNPDLISKFLSYLNSENFKITLVSKNFKDESLNLTEKWYGTKYSIEDIDIELMENLKKISNETEISDSVYHLPEKNEFIPTNFDLVKSKHIDDKEDKYKKYPKLIKSTQFCNIWFKTSTELGGPRSSITLKFNLPGSSSTPLNSSLLSIFIELLEDELNSVSYLANMSGLSQQFNLARDGMSLEIYGFSHKLDRLLIRLIDTVVKFINEDSMWDDKRLKRFDIIREKIHRSLKNFGYSVPYNQVGPMISSLINENAWLISDELESFSGVNYKSLRSFVNNLFSSCYIEILVVGNYDNKQALKLSNLIESRVFEAESKSDNKETENNNNNKIDNLGSFILTDSQFTRGRSLDLPLNKTFHYIKPNDDPNNINSCIESYIQLGKFDNYRDRVITELIAQILHEPFFNRLRTNEQLGYVVFSGLRETRTTFGLRLLIQSERSTSYLLSRIESFLKKLKYELNNNLTIEEFEKHVNAVIQKKLQKPKNLKEEKIRYWNRIATGFYDFNRRETDINILKSIKIEELIKFFNDKVINDDSNGKIIVHLQSQKIPKISIQKIIKSNISNYIFENIELNDLNIKSTDIDSLVDKLIGEEDKFDLTGDEVESLINNIINSDLFNEIFTTDFKFKNEMKDYIISESKNTYPLVSNETNELVSHIGEFKTKVPLTVAAYPMIDLKEYYDRDIILSKL